MPQVTPPRKPNDPAFIAISNIGPAAVSYLIESLQRQDGLVDALKGKAWRGAPLSLRTNYLAAPFPAVQWRRNAAGLLGLMNAEEAIPALMQAMSDPDHRVRQASARALLAHAGKARSAVPVLIKALADTDSEVGRVAFVALDRLETPPAKIETQVKEWKRTRSPDFIFMRFVETNNLSGPMTVLVLGEMLKEGSNPLRREVLNRLQYRRDTAIHALPHLTALLKEADPGIQLLALKLLETIGPAADAALPEVERLKAVEDEEVGTAAASAFRKIARTPN